MAKQRKGTDYEGWVLRMIDKAEDIKFSYSHQSWLEFAQTKLNTISDAQADKLEELRDIIFMKFPEEIGLDVRERRIYQDKLGRFTKEPTGKYLTRVRYQGPKLVPVGRRPAKGMPDNRPKVWRNNVFLSKADADRLVASEIAARGVRKGKNENT